MAKGRAAAFVAALTKAKQYAHDNPERTSETIGKVEDFVRTKAGPKHAGRVGQGADALRKGLGVQGAGRPGSSSPEDGQVPPPPPTTTS